MTLQTEQRVIPAHAVPVIDDADQGAAAGADLDSNAMGSGVDGVLDELLDDGGRAFDDLAGGNLIRDVIREQADAVHDLGRWSGQ